MFCSCGDSGIADYEIVQLHLHRVWDFHFLLRPEQTGLGHFSRFLHKVSESLDRCIPGALARSLIFGSDLVLGVSSPGHLSKG